MVPSASPKACRVSVSATCRVSVSAIRNGATHSALAMLFLHFLMRPCAHVPHAGAVERRAGLGCGPMGQMVS